MSTAAPVLSVSKTHKTFVNVDGVKLRARVKRFTQDEDVEFVSKFNFYGKEATRATIALKPRAGEEGLSEMEIEALREGELTPEAREAKLEQDRKDHREANEWANEQIRKYITLEPGQVRDADLSEDAGVDVWVTTGEDILRTWGHQPQTLQGFVSEIFLMNRLDEAKKKHLWLLRDFKTSLADAAPEPGKTPAPTAADASPAATTNSGTAAELLETSPSSPMDGSSVSDVPSES